MSDEPNDFLAQFQPDRDLLQAFVEKTEAVFWVADPDSFQLVYVSPHAEKSFDISQEEWTRPLFWQTRLHLPDQERVLAGFRTAVDEQTIHQFEYRLKANDGALVWIRNTVCVVAEGPPQLCGMMTDVTAYKTAVEYSDDAPGYASIFLETVTLLSENSDINQRLGQLAEKLGNVFEVTAVNILDWDNNLGRVTRLAYFRAAGFFTQSDQNSYSLAGLEGSLKWLSATQPVLIHTHDPSLSKWEEHHLQKYNAKTILYLPLREQNELIGCIELIESRRQRNFSQNDIELGHKIAQQTALTLARAQLFQKEARRRREAEILLDVAEFISSSLDRDEILHRVMELVRVYLNDVQNCAILLITKDGKGLEIVHSWRASDEFSLMSTGQIVQIKDTFSAQLAIEGGQPVAFTDLKEIPFSNTYTSQKIQEGLRAILCVPLKIQNRALGTIHVHYWHQPRQFTVEEIALVQGVANQTAIAIENARLFANERRQLRLSQTLQKVGSLLTASLQLEEVYEQIFGLLDKVVTYSAAFLYLFDEGNEQFKLVAFRGIDQALATNPPSVLPSNHLLSQIPLPPGWTVISDVDTYDAWIDYSGDNLIKSWIGALLVVKGEMIGILNINGATPRQFSDEDGQMVAAFANQAAIAIENARLYDETMRQTKELAILNQVAQETAVSLDIDTFLEKITKAVAADIYPHKFGFVMGTVDDEEIKRHPSYHGISDIMRQDRIGLTQGIIGQVYQTGLPYVAPNVREDPYFHGILENIQSEIVIPLKVNYQVIGVINAESPELNAFSSRDVGFLMTLAGNIAAVLERARLYDTLHIQAVGLAEQVAERTNELQFERDRLFTILESAGEGIILTDTEARIVYVNQAMERQSGYSRDELIDENPRIFGNGQMPKSTFAEMWQHLLKLERWVGELVNQSKDGKNYDVAVNVTPIMGADEIVTGYISIQSDISRLKELDRLKTQFIANVSHQLRTPLTNIKTYVSLLEKGKPEKFPRYFSVLHFEIDRLARLIQDLLDISRLDAEGPPNPNAVADFNEFWEEFWPPIIERAAWEDRTVETIFPDGVRTRNPLVFMESYQLEKVMSRLIENALAYSDEGSKVQITVAWGKQGKLEIKVCDEGVGVPEAERPFIFDRFFRGAQAIESGLPGNGLGLAIVKELLLRYGGDISLESEVGKGSCFTLCLSLVNQNISTL